MVGAGKADGSLDEIQQTKALARGEPLYWSNNINSIERMLEADTALVRRFQQILVEEPNIEDTISILRGLKKYEVHHGVKMAFSNCISSRELSERYINDRFLPDKAIDLMDEAASRIRLQIDLSLNN